jgi:adenosylcobinamide kinase / adenosylcobinamide-phosphate guanylyltransferase
MQNDPMARVTLVLGGARSGKSAWAENALKGGTYIATAEALDHEMADRIRRHRHRRGPAWSTVEAPIELPDAIEEARRPLLVDCLTLWLSNLMQAGRDVDAETGRLCAALGAGPGPVVVVANEVGLGIVPDNPLARAFRDHAGRVNQRVAAVADRVVLMVAGIPMVVK